MKYRKFLLVFCFTIILLGISYVNAADNNDTLQANEESDLIEISQQDVLNASDSGTFTALQKKIDDASKGATITLENDYTYDEGFSTRGIVIDKDLTIDGNGHTIDAQSKSRIFLIKFGAIKNHQVTLTNIKFTNGNTEFYGGAIFNYANLTVNKCTFTNNYAKYCGGAINSIGNLVCTDSVFSKNTADGDGGALFTFSIQKSVEFFNILSENRTDDTIMDFLSDLTSIISLEFATDHISGCTFTSNAAKGTGGGAVYAFSHIDIKSSAFKSNTAGQKGGAVFGNKDLYITSSKFTSNTAGKYGGAVYFRCHESSGHYENGTWVSEVEYHSNLIQTSTFTKNSAARGGAIYGFRASDSDTVHCAKAVKCTFEANKATSGRDIYGGTATNCVFNYLKLTLKKVKVKKSAKKLTLKAKLKKGNTLLKGKKITFKFNGKKYKAKTNKKGIAKVTVKKNILKKLKVGKKVKYTAKYSTASAKKTVKVKK